MPASSKPQVSGERWWWAWRVWLALALAWLGACLWLGREPAAWSQGWAGWWTGNRTGSGQVGSAKVHVESGAEIALADGDPVFRTTGGFFVLGNWQKEQIPWTWAGWVRVQTASGRWPTNFLRIRWAQRPGSVFRLGFQNGIPRAELKTSSAGTPGDQRVKAAVQASTSAPLNRWMHLAFSTDGERLRLMLDGRTVGEQSLIGTHDEALHLASLRLCSLTDAEALLQPRADPLSAEQDDVVLYHRAVPPEELAALVARGRGAWARELDRPQLARAIWHRGWPVVLVTMGLLLMLQGRPRLRRWLAGVSGILISEAGRPVRWVLVCGGLISVVLTVALHRQARQADEARFAQLVGQLKGETDVYWQQVAALLMRARDWVAAQTNLSQANWEAWLEANLFGHEYPGVLGVGYAEQVLPANLAAHESVWAARHGFNYRVHPPAGPEREVTGELAGNPSLPVVLYGALQLPRDRWFTNGTMLGRDMLYRRRDNPRAWCEGRRVETAVARNEMTGSALETIAPAGWYGEAVEGLRLYAPWTLRTKKDVFSALAPADWRGLVFASVDIRGPLLDRYGGSTPMIGCRIIEGGMGGELHETVADTGTLLPETADRPDAMLRDRLAIRFYHHRLFVDVWTTRAFEAGSFRRWVWIAGACSGGLTLLSAALLLAQARARTRLEGVLADLRRANGDLFLSNREREQMSRDLHDGSIQNLYALGLHLQRVQQSLPEDAGRAREGLTDGLDLLNQSIGDLRRFLLAAGLEDAAQNTVPAALETLAARLRKASPAEVTLRVAPEAAALGARHGVQVINVVREAASNALRHAGARHIGIRLEPEGVSPGGARRWVVEIRDNGRGFDPGQAAVPGHGLANLAARAEELGGSSSVISTPGEGTRVRVEFDVSDRPGQGTIVDEETHS